MKIVGLIDAVVQEAASFLDAASATLYILDREKGALWARQLGQPGTQEADRVQVGLFTGTDARMNGVLCSMRASHSDQARAGSMAGSQIVVEQRALRYFKPIVDARGL